MLYRGFREVVGEEASALPSLIPSDGEKMGCERGWGSESCK